MFGLAVASRPHLVFTGLTAATGLAVLFVRRRGYASGLRSRGFLAFCVAYMLVGAVVAAYNYARFGNPLEFGFTYQLAGPGQNRLDFSTRNLIPGLYFMLLSRPELSPVFPWMRMVFRFPFDFTRYPLATRLFHRAIDRRTLDRTVRCRGCIHPFYPLADSALKSAFTIRSTDRAVDRHCGLHCRTCISYLKSPFDSAIRGGFPAARCMEPGSNTRHLCFPSERFSEARTDRFSSECGPLQCGCELSARNRWPVFRISEKPAPELREAGAVVQPVLGNTAGN